VARMERRDICTGFLVLKSEKSPLEYLTVDGRVILKRLFNPLSLELDI